MIENLNGEAKLKGGQIILKIEFLINLLVTYGYMVVFMDTKPQKSVKTAKKLFFYDRKTAIQKKR
jgi:hypothetical protein